MYKTLIDLSFDAIEGMRGAYQAYGIYSGCCDEVLSTAGDLAEPTCAGSNKQFRVRFQSMVCDYYRLVSIEHGGKGRPIMPCQA